MKKRAKNVVGFFSILSVLASANVDAIEIKDPAVRELSERMVVSGFNAEKIFNAIKMTGKWKDVLDFSWSKSAKLPDGVLSKLENKGSGAGKKQFKLTVHPDVMKNPVLTAEILTEIESILPSDAFPQWNETYQAGSGRLFRWIEYSENAELGSTGGKYGLKITELEAVDDAFDNLFRKLGVSASKSSYKTFIEGESLGSVSYSEDIADPIAKSVSKIEPSSLIDYMRARYKSVYSEYKAIGKEYKAARSTRRKSFDKKKTTFTNLEKQEKKLDDLIAAGDRKKVRQMLETYLPWELMEPTDEIAWRSWLDAIENPGKQKVTLFRGLEGDVVKDATTGIGKFTFSTILAKNQGNYTRRLRSLATMYDRLNASAGASNLLGFSLPFEVDLPPTALANLMHAHAQNPLGSPFISMSSNFGVANGFAGDGRRIALIKIPENRMIRNAMSGFQSEVEYLAPLIIFPDEMVYVYDAAQNADELNTAEAFRKLAKDKAGVTLTAAQLEQAEPWKVFFATGFTEFKGYMPSSCPNVFIPEYVY